MHARVRTHTHAPRHHTPSPSLRLTLTRPSLPTAAALRHQLINSELVHELRTRTIFTWVELDKLCPEELSENNYVLVDGKCYVPKERDWQSD